MTRIRYNGPSHLLVCGEVTVKRGEEADVEDVYARRLAGCSYADITIILAPQRYRSLRKRFAEPYRSPSDDTSVIVAPEADIGEGQKHPQ